MTDTTDSSKGTVLIVDDTPANLRVLAQLLTRQGYRARAVPSGLYALSSLQSAMPDLILLDIMMPEMDGYEVCRRLKENEQSRDIPIIFISAVGEAFDKVKAFSMGAVDFITKPFQDEEVLVRVENHLARRRLQQALYQKNKALAEANSTLEEKVAARTHALAEANNSLQAEIERRQQHQQEKDRLFELAQQQSEQLRFMTHSLLEAQQDERQGLSTGLSQQIQQKITLLLANMATVQSLLPPQPDPRLSAILTESLHILTEMDAYLRDVTTGLHHSEETEGYLRDDLLLQLSARERQVLKLLSDGRSTADIADILTLTVGTVQTYIKRMRQKLDIPDLAGLIRFAQAQNLR
jgi:DNA-binding response OmpR family regulator/DNA-binding CsgD family transcriptional regulator